MKDVWDDPGWIELHTRGHLLGKALTGLETMSAEGLDSLLRACQRVTTTNCGWDAYKLAPILKREIVAERKRRLVRGQRAAETVSADGEKE